jgi:hypothetical protein
MSRAARDIAGCVQELCTDVPTPEKIATVGSVEDDIKRIKGSTAI